MTVNRISVDYQPGSGEGDYWAWESDVAFKTNVGGTEANSGHVA